LSSGTSSIEIRFRADDALDVLRMRSAVEAFFDEAADETSDVAGALLVFGELVANVVRHAPGAIAVRIDWPIDGPVMLYVDDCGPGPSRAPEQSEDPLRESGRGIDIVRALSRGVKIVATPTGGTHVSAELPLGRRRRASV